MKNAFDLNHVKSVTAVALFFQGEPAGRIVANWSDNPAGSVCTATTGIWGGPLAALELTTGRAGGYGYDKFSAAVEDALRRGRFALEGRGNFSDTDPTTGKTALELAPVEGGTGNQRKVFEALGYTWFPVIGG